MGRRFHLNQIEASEFPDGSSRKPFRFAISEAANLAWLALTVMLEFVSRSIDFLGLLLD